MWYANIHLFLFFSSADAFLSCCRSTPAQQMALSDSGTSQMESLLRYSSCSIFSRLFYSLWLVPFQHPRAHPVHTVFDLIRITMYPLFILFWEPFTTLRPSLHAGLVARCIFSDVWTPRWQLCYLFQTYVIGYPIYSIYTSANHEGVIFIVTAKSDQGSGTLNGMMSTTYSFLYLQESLETFSHTGALACAK